MTKQCCECQKTFPIEEFIIGKKRKLKRARCRPCNAARQSVRDKEPKMRFSHGKAHCKQRGIIWGLTFDEWSVLNKLPCQYCGSPLATYGTGLDRKIPALGYTTGNVVPCCPLCNDIKRGLLSHQDMLIVGKAVIELQQARKNRGDEPLRRNFFNKKQRA